MKVLFLSAWYPHRYDAMVGLFVRKHAEAVARRADVCVLFPLANNHVSDFEVVDQLTNGVREIYVYFPAKNHCQELINTYKAYQKGLSYVFRNFGKPDITHANILSKASATSLYLKRKYGIPYVVAEHWSGYLPENGTFANYNLLKKWWMRHMAKQAAKVMPVSQMLQDAMKAEGFQANFACIYNVVDDGFYQPLLPGKRSQKRLVHVSCFDEQAKNVCGILRAIKTISEKRTDFELVLVGTGVDFEKVVAFSKQLDLPNNLVRFVGEQTPEEVHKWLENSDFMIMFSNYETAGVIFSECWASGKPLVSTPVGILANQMNTTNGIAVKVRNEKDLAKKTDWMIDHFQDFNAEKIRKSSLIYSYESVGKQLMAIYQSAISSK